MPKPTDVSAKVASLPDDKKAKVERFVERLEAEQEAATPLSAEEVSAAYDSLSDREKLRLTRQLRRAESRAGRKN